MTTNQLRRELVESMAKIRHANDVLKALRARHTDLKARLTEARAAKKAKGAPG